MSPDNPIQLGPPPAIGDVSGQWHRFAKEARGLRATDWIGFGGLILAAFTAFAGLSLYLFESRTEGEVLKTRFDSHVTVYESHVTTQKEDAEKLDARLGRMDNKLDRLLERRTK